MVYSQPNKHVRSAILVIKESVGVLYSVHSCLEARIPEIHHDLDQDKAVTEDE